MAQKTRAELKPKFETGDRPTQQDFENVFDSFHNILDDTYPPAAGRNIDISGESSLTILAADASPNGEKPLMQVWMYNGSEWELTACPITKNSDGDYLVSWGYTAEEGSYVTII